MSPRHQLSAPMTLVELHRQLWPEQPVRLAGVKRLRRMLRKREAELAGIGKRVTLYHCECSGAKGYVTAAELREHLPWLFDRAGEMTSAVLAAVGELREQVEVTQGCANSLQRRVVALERMVDGLRRAGRMYRGGFKQ